MWRGDDWSGACGEYVGSMGVPLSSENARSGAGGTLTSVLLVEDEQSIAEPFAQALARNGFEPTIASTAAEALRLGRERHPDIVLLDLTLPDGDGRDVCRELRRDSNVPIIMLTARGTVTDRVVGLELGADDYIVKPFATGEVISRIRAVLRRARVHAAGVEDAAATAELAVGDLRLDVPARRAWLGDRELDLTRKELDLLARLMRDAGRVVTRETLMSEVWDENWFGSTKTLDVHIAGLRRKLGDDPARPRYIQHGARRRLSLLHTRGDGAVSLRTGLLAALAYIAAARDRCARRAARAEPRSARQRRGALAGPGPGRSRGRDRRGPTRAEQTRGPAEARALGGHVGARARDRRRRRRQGARRQRRHTAARVQLRRAP